MGQKALRPEPVQLLCQDTAIFQFRQTVRSLRKGAADVSDHRRSGSLLPFAVPLATEPYTTEKTLSRNSRCNERMVFKVGNRMRDEEFREGSE